MCSERFGPDDRFACCRRRGTLKEYHLFCSQRRLQKERDKNRCRLGDVHPNMGVIVAPPQIQLYIDCAAEIYGVFLKYFAPEDIYVYSIDESFIRQKRVRLSSFLGKSADFWKSVGCILPVCG